MKDEPIRTTANPAATSWKGWTCDELTPTFCEVQMMDSGTISVRGNILVRYWIYKATTIPTKSAAPLWPIVVVHGGPGFPHNYLLSLKQQACQGRSVIFYDQAGCGASALPINSSIDDDFPWLLDPAYYATQELPTMIGQLRLERYHIVAHSWGTMLSQLFALQRPAGLESMVLSGPLSDSRLWQDAMWDRDSGALGQLPPFIEARIKFLEENELYDSAEYKALAETLTAQSVCRTFPVPDCYRKSEQTMNREIYVRMQGPSEFRNGGVLADFNTTGQLSQLDALPVLLTYGAFDTVSSIVVETMHHRLPLSEVILFPRSGHVTSIDEPGVMNYKIADFLDRVEAGHFQPEEDVSNRSIGVVACICAILISLFVGCWLGCNLSERWWRRRRHREDAGYRAIS